MEMVERVEIVARLLCEYDGEDPDAQIDGPGGEVWNGWWAYADRATTIIAALSPPPISGEKSGD